MRSKLRLVASNGGKPASQSRQRAARRLRLLRHELGLCQEEVAALSGKTRRTIGAWERAEVDLGAAEVIELLEGMGKKEKEAA